MDARTPGRQRARLHTIGLGMVWCCCACLPASALVRTAATPQAPAEQAVTTAADTRAADLPSWRSALLPAQVLPDQAPKPRAAAPAEPEPAVVWVLAGALATLLSLRRHVRAPGLLAAAARPTDPLPVSTVPLSRR